jgi:hypothetical protein
MLQTRGFEQRIALDNHSSRRGNICPDEAEVTYWRLAVRNWLSALVWREQPRGVVVFAASQKLSDTAPLQVLSRGNRCADFLFKMRNCCGVWLYFGCVPERCGALSAFEPTWRDLLGCGALFFKQLPEYEARWRSGAYSESAVQRRERVGTCEIGSGGSSGVRRDRGNIVLLMGRS